jgi:hypothetical protein
MPRKLKNGNPTGPTFGPDWPGERCGAKSKQTGLPCKSPAMANGRCRMHGGKSTGPKTKEGLDHMRRSKTRHGLYVGPDHPDFERAGPRWPGWQRRINRKKLKEIIRKLRKHSLWR